MYSRRLLWLDLPHRLLYRLLQRVENYEYELPSDFEDEEIDEDTAFTEADKRQFADWFADEPEGELPIARAALILSVALWC